MQTTFKRAAAQGFTLIELLIVVIILAILAAIAIPQFANSTSDAKEATLDANLATIRSAIEQYKSQHGEYPGFTTSVSTCSATKGTGAAGSEAAFLEQMTMASNAKGETCSIADATFRFGPYVRRGMPTEPINNVATVVVTATGAPIVAGAAGGWAYDAKSGQFIMNSSDTDKSATPKAYSLH